MIQRNNRLWLSPIIKKSEIQEVQLSFPPLPDNIPLSPAERLPDWLFYLPGAIWWLCLAVYYRSLTLPCLVNPTINLGGMADETKSANYRYLMRTSLQEYVPKFFTLYSHQHSEAELLQMMQDTGIDFPMVAKPDVGCKGLGVRVVTNMQELQNYIAAYPEQQDILLCEFIDYREEFGAFYVKLPTSGEFIVPSLTLKYPFLIKGDGVSTIRQLLGKTSSRRRLLPLAIKRYGDKLEEILPEDSYFRTTAIGSHTSGSVFRDGEMLIDSGFKAQLQKISEQMPEFNYVRFDIKCSSFEDFKQGKNFKIIEVNGASAEMTHIWDPEGSLWRAWAGIFLQVSLLFKVGHQIRKQNNSYISPSLRSLWQAFRTELKKRKSLPVSS